MHDGLIERDGKHFWQLRRAPGSFPVHLYEALLRPVDREAGGARQMFRAVCMLIRFRDEHFSMFVSMELVDHRKYCPVEICSAIFLYMWIYIPFLVSSDPKKTNKP